MWQVYVFIHLHIFWLHRCMRLKSQWMDVAVFGSTLEHYCIKSLRVEPNDMGETTQTGKWSNGTEVNTKHIKLHEWILDFWPIPFLDNNSGFPCRRTTTPVLPNSLCGEFLKSTSNNRSVPARKTKRWSQGMRSILRQNQRSFSASSPSCRWSRRAASTSWTRSLKRWKASN